MLKTAIILTIGNEILSGDVLDENSNWVAKKLFSLGVDLKFIFVLPDDIEIIKTYILENNKKYDFIITIGGMGPTPDDVTKDAIAKAFNVPLSKNEIVADLIKKYYKGQASEEKFLMSIFPETSAPILTSNGEWAVGLKINNVFSFPGTPFLVKDSFPQIEEFLKSEPIFKTKIDINCEETLFAEIMVSLSNKYPDVSIGSYPSEKDFRKVKLIFKSRDKLNMQNCRNEFITTLKDKFNNLEIS